jgi:hypothetical protein
VAKYQLGHSDDSTDHNRGDRDEEDSQAENSIDYPVHSPPPAPSGAKALFYFLVFSFWVFSGTTVSRALPGLAFLQFREASTIRHEFLVELTGIEPVASWLQTRRSPS